MAHSVFPTAVGPVRMWRAGFISAGPMVFWSGEMGARRKRDSCYVMLSEAKHPCLWDYPPPLDSSPAVRMTNNGRLPVSIERPAQIGLFLLRSPFSLLLV